MNEWQKLRTEMDEYVMPDSLRERLQSELADVERLLARASTSEEARTAREIVQECKEKLGHCVGQWAINAGEASRYWLGKAECLTMFWSFQASSPPADRPYNSMFIY